MKVILIAGPDHCGKSTFANMLKGHLERFGKSAVITSFADPIYEIAEHLKGEPIDRENKTVEEREFLRILGTAARIAFGPNVWCIKWLKKALYQIEDYIIVDDVRFDNEVNFVQLHATGILVLEVINRTQYSDEHVSNMGINLNLVDYQINNHYELSDLNFKAMKIAEGINDGRFCESF